LVREIRWIDLLTFDIVDLVPVGRQSCGFLLIFSGTALCRSAYRRRSRQVIRISGLAAWPAAVLLLLAIGADFRFEVPGQSSVGLIGGGRVNGWGGTMASAEHKPIMGVWGHSPQRGPGAEPLVSGSGGEAPLKLKAFWSLDVQWSRQI